MTENNNIMNYVKRIDDLYNPLPPDCPLFLPPRPDNPAPEYKPSQGVRLPKLLTEEEKVALREEYRKYAAQPATLTCDTFDSDGVTEVLDGKGWVVPNLLTEDECEEVIQAGEDWGIGGVVDQRLAGPVRTSERTNSYYDTELSMKLNRRLPEDLLVAVEATDPCTSVRGLHPNWRVARYRRGEQFPAHQDQADSVMVQHPERVRQRYTSSHTLLINLRRRGEHFQGGATRFFMDGTYGGRTIDICLPQGYALVFQQRGLLHAGQPVTGDGVKYIAQAGLLRSEPAPGVITASGTTQFKYGPGLAVHLGGSY